MGRPSFEPDSPMHTNKARPRSFIVCKGGGQGFNLHEIDEILICSNIIALAQVRAK